MDLFMSLFCHLTLTQKSVLIKDVFSRGFSDLKFKPESSLSRDFLGKIGYFQLDSQKKQLEKIRSDQEIHNLRTVLT